MPDQELATGSHGGKRKSCLPLLLVLIFCEIAFFTFYGISRHYNYLTSINDLGCFDQAIWGFLHGAPFLNTILFSEPVNWLGVHFHPVLALFVPFYLFWESVIWLILAQAIALPLAALPIFFLSRKVTNSEQAALFWGVACLASPFLLSAASWDFHPISLAVPFIALSCLAVEQGRFCLLLGCCLFILLCKEHLGLMVMGFGLVWYVRQRQLIPSVLFVLIGIGHFLFIFKVLMPAFSPSGEHLMLTEGLGHLSRYAWLGNSLEGILGTLLTQPFDTARIVLITMDGWMYLLFIFLPLLGLPLLGFEFILPALGDLLANILSATPMPRSVSAYHSVPLVPLLISSAIIGSKRAVFLVKVAKPERLAFMAMGMTLIFAWVLFPFFSLPGSFQFWMPKRVLSWHDENYNTVKRLVGSNLSISVQSNMGAHFSQRHEIYTFPEKINKTDAIILHLASPTTLVRINSPYRIGSLGQHLQMKPEEFLITVQNLLNQDYYNEVIFLDPWLILIKNKVSMSSKELVKKKIEILQKEWVLSTEIN